MFKINEDEDGIYKIITGLNVVDKTDVKSNSIYNFSLFIEFIDFM